MNSDSKGLNSVDVVLESGPFGDLSMLKQAALALKLRIAICDRDAVISSNSNERLGPLRKVPLNVRERMVGE